MGDLWAARFQVRLNRVEGRLVDDRRNLDRDHFVSRLQFLRLAALVELMPTRIGRAGQHPMHRANPPTSAVAGEDTAFVEVLGDRLYAHRPGRAVAFQRQLERQPHRIGVQRVNLQLLLDLRAALLGRHDAVADRRQRAIPEALPGILLQRAQDVLCVLLRLIFVEQRHDLPHHHVHRIVAHLLGDRQQLDPVLGELADVELQLEMVAEEAREAVDHDDIERRGLGRARFDHALELRPTIIGRRRARLDEGVNQLQPARQAIGFALFALIGDRHVMLRLPRRRDAQIEGGAQRHGHGNELLTSLARPEQLVEDIAEPCLKYIHLGGRDRDALWPVVCDGPGRKIVLWRSPGTRPDNKRHFGIVE
nr:hypothetical protein [Brevundimonas aurantiaca]